MTDTNQAGWHGNRFGQLEKTFFFLNYFILKYQFNVLLLGNYLQYLHDDTTDEKKVVLRSAGVIFIHILGD